jgi:uncharacterized protein YjdB
MATKLKLRLFSFTMAVMFMVTGWMVRLSPKVYAATEGPELLITEIMPMSQAGDDAYEYIEIYNNSDSSIDLADYKLPYQNIDIVTSKIIPSKEALVICTRNTSLEGFNLFYGTTLTQDKYVALPSAVELMNNTTPGSIILAKDDSSVTVRARYEKINIYEKKSIGYKYPQTGFDMNLVGFNQNPTPGIVSSEQIPFTGIRVTGIVLDRSVITMEVNQTAALLATISPSTATNKAITWSSSNSSIVGVNTNGTISAKSEGVAVVTAKAADGGFAASCVVEVKRISVTGIILDKTNVNLDAGRAMVLTPSIVPQNATNKSLIWSSSNSSIASVDSNGLIIGKSQGTALITVKTADGGYTAVCTVMVSGTSVNVPVTGVSLSKTNVSLEVGNVIILESTVTPSAASNKQVVWQTSNAGIASVDENGIVTAKQAGVALITVRTVESGYTASCLVTVVNRNENTLPVSGVKLDKNILEISSGQGGKLTATVLPENATNKSVIWASSDSSVVAIDAAGNIKALKEGIAVITVTAKDGNFKDICVVIVKKSESIDSKIIGIRLNKTVVRIDTGKFEKVVPIFTPGNVKDKTVTWKTSDSKVAVVTNDGRIIGLRKGVAVVTATTKDGKKSSTCYVYVSDKKEQKEGKDKKQWGWQR